MEAETGSHEISLSFQEKSWIHRAVSFASRGILDDMANDTATDRNELFIRYLDGSTLTLGSETVVIVSAGSQKRATIRSGSIAAAIQPQPEGKPFVIHTATAKFEILGTRFEIDARTDTTCIQVNEGTVRATRKVDGAVVDVPALHSAVAGLEAGRELRAIPRPEPAFEWSSQLEAGAKYTVGDWLPEQGECKARLRATPFLFQKTGRPTQVVYRASIHLPFNEQRVIQLKPEALVVVRGWLESSAEVEVMLSTRTDGRFGGNYFYRSTPSVGERFEIRASISAFVGAQGYESARVPPDAVLRKVVAITVGADAGLQVESVELVLPGSAAVTMAGKRGDSNKLTASNGSKVTFDETP
jgi:hypothetical protein